MYIELHFGLIRSEGPGFVHEVGLRAFDAVGAGRKVISCRKGDSAGPMRYSFASWFWQHFGGAMDALFSKDSILLGPERSRSQALSACEAGLLIQLLVELIGVAEGDAERRVRFRNLALFATAMNTPTRMKDLCGFRYRDLFDENDELRDYPVTLNGVKGSETIRVPFRDMVRELLELYRARLALHYKIHADRYLFEQNGGPVTMQNARATLIRLTEDLGISKTVGFNTPRNTFGACVYEKADDKLEAAMFIEYVLGRKGEGHVLESLGIQSGGIDFARYFGDEFTVGCIDFQVLDRALSVVAKRDVVFEGFSSAIEGQMDIFGA